MCISVHNEQYFHIADDTDPTRGLTLKNKNDCPFIICPPRGQTLDLLPKSGMQKILFDSLEKCTRLRKNSLKRGKNRRIFGDNEPPMYCCAGLQASRTGGVDDHPAYLSSLSGTDWCSIMKMMHWAENCFESIVDYNILSHIRAARAAVPFKTMSAPNDKFENCKPPAPAKYFGGVAFGCNVYLQCHRNQDFTLSIAQIHLKGLDKYSANDKIVVYFCFPTIGVAVALRPGDFLLFDATIPHCISLQSHKNDSIMCVSMYLKTAFVGMSDNSITLTRSR